MAQIPTYTLEAWTDEGEVRFSGRGLSRQLWIYEEDASIDHLSVNMTWEDYERLTYLIWSRGMFLLSQGEFRESYDCFLDGARVCEEAVRALKVPVDGGLHPFLIAFDDMYDGCHRAAMEEGYSLEEVFENREQIEISRYYEKLPKPTLLATEEFINGNVYYRDPSKDNQ